MSQSDPTAASRRTLNPLLSPFKENPHPFYERARAEEPVYYNEVLQAWIVTRHEDVATILREPHRFSSLEATKGGPPYPPEVLAILAEGTSRVPTLVDNDPPDHTRFRSLVNKAFTPRRIAEREPFIRELANGLIDKFVNDGQADIVEQFSHPLASMVIADILGVPREDISKFKGFSDAVIGVLACQAPLPELIEYAKGMVAFHRYLKAQLEAREKEPRDDMFTDLVQNAPKAEPPISMNDLLGMLEQILFAGHETTSGLIAATVLHLLRNPDVLARARQDKSVLAAAIEEAARLETPVWAIYRITKEDVELSGVRIPKGERVQICYMSANRDEAKFACPHALDVSREHVTDHLAYGRGIHFCIGAPLARLEAKIALDLLFERLPNLQLVPDQTISIVPSATIRRLEHLLVRWDIG